ncbi:5'/3'-nucleotidase SurE [Halobiforma lacisalsi AJ5]|uniref:5'-nucleotidase SurE n=1 Tax=Natronobacterium lacisalsi AJ5 TaxID=358396 RepID=M0LP03_NATLA|nr:5'/3'-nucleotidase SurE [Halobiforma lacisalsi]APW99420.1 5'/3'-nucleotidase SurE [Halobiforma lacisalsi AJ5]EMA35277.1 stationary-phase survival protein SurE [Halobiforma lacisalsi AJ5]
MGDADAADLEILLTNDDGIDSTGIRALHDALSAFADVTVVAPANDQSACGRSISHEVDVYDHELGFALDGTPADCVVAGLSALTPETVPDLVVAGCNEGANLGEYVLGRSGTISAAVEAAFFDVPAIATSMYVPVDGTPLSEVDLEPEDYAEAIRVTSYLAETALEAGVFDHAAYLNVNVPLADGEPAPVEITRPSKRYEMDAEREGDRIHMHDRVWESMDPETLPDPEGTDRRAVVEGRISVSPLTAPHSTNHHELLEELADGYHESRGIETDG